MSNAGTTTEVPEALAWDLADRLNKALRIGRVKPGQMRAVLGVSESTMTNYLNGSTRPKDGFLRQWALRCGYPITFEWLKDGVIELGPDTPDDLGSRDSGCYAAEIVAFPHAA